MNKEIRQAYAILKKVYNDQSFAGIELNKTIRREYGNVNTNLITKIVYGVIEKDVYLDYAINQFVSSKPKKDVSLLLKLGTYILKFLDSIPAFACVDEIVEITKLSHNKTLAGFVNATLKNISKKEIMLPAKENGLVQYLSIRYSYPEWIVEKLLKEHKEQFVEDLLAKELTTLTHIRVLKNKISIDDFLQLLTKNNVEYKISAFENTFYVEYSQLLKIKDIQDCYIVQGLPSMIVSKNIAEDSKKILDLCASPGGKSVLIAQENPNIEIISCDVSDFRVELINKYIQSYDIKNVKTCLNDATILREDWIEQFDTVMCDVPCSNLGIANKKPDVLLNRTSDGLKEIIELQLKIIETASKYVKPGGVLLYSTCSIMKEENEIIVGKFLQNNKKFKISNVNTYGVEVEKYHNLVTFYPHISNCEGFFIGRLVKQ